MNDRIAVIGLGAFGRSLINSFAQFNFNVIAIDKDNNEIDKIKNLVDRALILDITNEDAFEEINWNEIEIAIVAIGEPNLESSIIIVSLLKQANVPRIIARSSSDIHSRILKNVGATEIINPAKDIAELLVNKLAMPNIIHIHHFDDKNIISEFIPPASFINKSILSLELRKKYKISIIAIRRISLDKKDKINMITNPNPNEIIQNDDILIGIGEKSDFDRLNKLG